ncbi:glycosyltransferase [bacterium]|jgi:glycosyltransferase involved in cell wall biosynthesis|nr:glycosyltransferase [bacterium]
MKNIAFYIPLLNMGGAEKVVIDILNQIVIDDLNHKFYLIVDNVNSKLINKLSKNITILHLDNKNTFGLIEKIYKLKFLLNHYQIDLIISHLTHTNLHVSLSKLIFKDVKTKIVLTEHSILSDYMNSIQSLKQKVMSKLISYLYKKADKIISVSDAVKNNLITSWNIPNNLLIRIYNPINTIHITKLANEKIDDNIVELYKNKKIIVSIGRLEVQKNHILLLKSVNILKNDFQEFILLIVGGGSMKKELIEYVNKNKLERYVQFLDYQVNPYKYLKLANTFVLPSSFEGFGIVLVEALYLNKNIVSTNILASREVLENEKYGNLCEKNPTAMSNALYKSLCFDKDNFELSKKANEYRVEKITNEYISLIDNILDPCNTPTN